MNDEQYADWAAKVRADHPPDEANRILETGGPEQHAATIREAYRDHSWHHPERDLPPGRRCRTCEADEALDALVALAQGSQDWKVYFRERFLETQRAAEAAEERADRSDELMRRAESARSAAEERASDLENLMTDMAKTFDDERDRMRRDRSLWAAANNRERAQARREADELRAALDELLNVIVSRWHESAEDGRGLAAFMELTDQEYAAFAEQGPRGYVEVVARRAALAGVQAAPIVGTPGVVDCVDHRSAARCQRDHLSGRCICRAGVQASGLGSSAAAQAAGERQGRQPDPEENAAALCGQCGRQMTTEEAIRSDFCPDCDPPAGVQAKYEGEGCEYHHPIRVKGCRYCDEGVQAKEQEPWSQDDYSEARS